MNRIWISSALLVAACGSAHAITLGLKHDFTNGTVQNWIGAPSPWDPLNMDGGPAGAGDKYLDCRSNGGFGSGAKMAFYNNIEFAGDYLTAGVKVIECDMKNFTGSSALLMRVVMFGPLGTRFTTVDSLAVSVPVDNLWHHYRFFLNAASLINVTGTETYSQVMGGAQQLMFRHNAGSASFGGTSVAAHIGIDNIEALDATRAEATSIVVTSGSTFSGNLSSISAIDDQRYRFFDDDVTLVGEVVVTGTSPLATPSSVKFVLVCSAGRSGLAVSIDLFNYTTNGFVNFAGAESFASDTKFELSTSSASYVKATTREMKARATWAPVNDEDPSQDGWLQLINMANWSVAP